MGWPWPLGQCKPTVSFQSIGLSHVTGPVVLAKIWHMSHVTGTMDACDKWFSDEKEAWHN